MPITRSAARLAATTPSAPTTEVAPPELVATHLLLPVTEDLPPRTQQKVGHRMAIFQEFLHQNHLASHPHQLEGVRWCLSHELHPEPPFAMRGGFVADDMGLGKTIVMLGVIFANLRRRTLIVLPPILVQQWLQQIVSCQRHPTLLVYTADTRQRVQNAALARARIVITTYTMLHDPKLQLIQWDRVVFDEAHYLRNFNTQRYQQAKSLKADVRWLVSGTPVNNCMADYYNLCALLGMPAKAYIDMAMVLRRYVLRRTKQSVGLQLPPLTFHDIPLQCEREEEQFLHDFVHGGLPFSNIKPDVRRHNPDRNPVCKAMRKYSLIQYLTKARQMSSYMPFTRSKLNLVLGTLLSNHSLFPGTKHIVFCSYHEEIDHIQQELDNRGVGCTVVDGRNPMPEKLEEVLVLQINSCCEGLNLQQYSHLYFVMPHWNPAVEMQAIARSHRLGQMQVVHVHRFYFAAESSERMCTRVAATSLEAFLNMGPRTVYDDEPITVDQYVRLVQRKKCMLHLLDPSKVNESASRKRTRNEADPASASSKKSKQRKR